VRRARLVVLAIVAAAAATTANGAPRVATPLPGPDDDAPPQVTRLALPFDGAWGVVQGVGEGTHTGYATYALDFVPAVRRARAPKPGAALSAFPCFGRPVRAPADGTVVRVAASARDWPAYVKGRDEGNFVIVEHAPREFSELRHLRAGSVRVAVGQRVRRGDLVGACGNSGNAGTPHVHVALLSSIDPIRTRPAVFSNYEIREIEAGREVWRAPPGPLRPGDLVRPTTW